MSKNGQRAFKNHILGLHNLLYKFNAQVLRIIGFIASDAKELYRNLRWKFYTRRLDKIPTANGAEWIRDFRGWIVFNVSPIEFEMKTAVFDLLQGLGEILILTYIRSHKNGQTLLSNLVFLAQNGFGLSIDEIKIALSSPPKESNEDNCDVAIGWQNDIGQNPNNYG